MRESRAPGAQSVLYTWMISPLGITWIAAGCRGLVRVSSDEDEAAFCHAVERDGNGDPAYMPDRLRDQVEQLAEYFAGRRERFETPVDLGALNGFRRDVLEAVQEVPYGTVQSYADIARAVGRPGAARAVGTALRGNPVAFAVPCHRIIRSDGTLGEYGYRSHESCGVEYKRMLLAIEGVVFED